MMENIFCNSCGESVVIKDTDCVDVLSIVNFSQKEKDRAKSYFGKQKFNMCGVCFLKKLGFKKGDE